MKQKLLFITWDGPQTSYMEGLFLPIFIEIQKSYPIEFHILQFTWADDVKTQTIRAFAQANAIHYTNVPVSRKPIAMIGTLLTLFKGISVIEKYIAKHKISVVMPRSTMPAVMVNRLKNKSVRVIFDADGLPLEERIDFAGLSPQSKQYKWLKSEEIKLLKTSDFVITRSEKAIAIHLQNIGNAFKEKFSVVFNGRDTNAFFSDGTKRNEIRQQLKIDLQDKVFVYCGSLGPQYGWDEMMQVFEGYAKHNPKAKFLVLTGNPEFAKDRISKTLQNNVLLRSVLFNQVPDFLSAADVAFAIRKPTFSMQGVAPIKLGEYLLMGLPTIASKGIGDSEKILSENNNAFLFDHDDEAAVEKAIAFASETHTDVQSLRKLGMDCFSLKKSAESYINVFKKL